MAAMTLAPLDETITIAQADARPLSDLSPIAPRDAGFARASLSGARS